MKYIELFAGIGGFRYGLQEVGVKPEDSSNAQSGTSQYSEHTFHCVWANEIDKYASQIYRKNYAEGELHEGDIRLIRTEEIPEHDLLVGGFPCQAFSIAGKRAGFNDCRGTLFFEIARILRDRRPRCVLLENVKGLLSHDAGQTFQTILKVLSDIGYRTEWQVLNSKDFGVPQNRERVFIVGHLRGERRPEIFPIGETNSKDIIVSGVLDTETWRKRHEQIRRVHSPEGLSPTIPTGTGGGVMTKVDLCPCLNANDTRKGYSGQNRKFFDKTKMIRRLTPTECERLQGFPDGWTEGISDTQRYKCLGNAVTTNVITAIGKRLT